MSINHHLLAKTTTDSILANFKSNQWSCCENIGTDFYRVGTDSTFPSPDAAFYDSAKKLLVSFEFKPPTETKRGILTGLGQTIAYLNSCSLSYLIVPSKLEGFEMGEYMADLFKSQIEENLPIGLIVYENDNPQNVSLIHNVNKLVKEKEYSSTGTGRFWAKHLDMPIPLFHLILHCFYLKKTNQIDIDAFAYCWERYLVPRKVLRALKPNIVSDLQGEPIKTLSGIKNILFLEKRILSINKLSGKDKIDQIKRLKQDVKIGYVGDNYYNSVKKNFVTFLKHIGVIDNVGSLTDIGFKIYHLGLVNGPRSKIFFDYFTQIVLLIGHHLELIFDLDIMFNKYRGEKTVSEIRSIMLSEYEAKGMIKRNPNRQVGENSSVSFLKYEFILWNSLELTTKTAGKPELSFNWKKITEVCSLPYL